MVDITPTPVDKEEVNPLLGMANNRVWELHTEGCWVSTFQCINYKPPAQAKTEFKGLGAVVGTLIIIKGL